MVLRNMDPLFHYSLETITQQYHWGGGVNASPKISSRPLAGSNGATWSGLSWLLKRVSQPFSAGPLSRRATPRVRHLMHAERWRVLR